MNGCAAAISGARMRRVINILSVASRTMYISCGENVYAAGIEVQLDEHPCVLEAAVIEQEPRRQNYVQAIGFSLTSSQLCAVS